MNYAQTLQYLYEHLPMYQRSGVAAYKDNLDNTLALDSMFDHPHLKFKTIHVAGTNGKGSVSHQIASILQSAGYKVGLYTSPHLKDYRERIKINGEMISEKAVTNFVERFLIKNQEAQLAPSFFELSVLMAFDYFASQQTDIAVIEVGLGGRLDSTNIIQPEVSVITNISFDHTNVLGNTLEKIAGEKAGIIKKNVPVVIGETQAETLEVFKSKAANTGAPIVYADQTYIATRTSNGNYNINNECSVLAKDINLDLKGDYQQKNLLTTIAAIQILKSKGYSISEQAMKDGLSCVITQTGLWGRWQQIGTSPKIICDTGHNESGLTFVTNQLKKEKYEKLHMVFGTVNDKDITKILGLLPQGATYYFAKANIDRALDAKQLQSQAVLFNLQGNCYNSVSEAFENAKQNAGKNDLIFVGGSTFVVAEVI